MTNALLQEVDVTSFVGTWSDHGIEAARQRITDYSDSEKQSLLRKLCGALDAYSKHQFDRTVRIIRRIHEQDPIQSFTLFYLMCFSAEKASLKSELSDIIFHHACMNIDFDSYSKAIHCIKQMYSFGDGIYKNKWISEPEYYLKLAEKEELLASKLKQYPKRENYQAKSKKRLAMVTINLVDDMFAYAKTSMQFARYLDRDKYDCYLYYTEITHKDRPQDYPIPMTHPGSDKTAPKFLKELSELELTARFAPSNLDFLELVYWLVDSMEEDEIDAVIFQAGLNAPDQWLASRLSPVPVRMSLCLGINTYQKGQYATVYMNEENLKRESEFWNKDWGRQVFISGGADIKEAVETPALKRSDYHIPDDAVVFGMMSNTVDKRVLDEYMDCVIKVLKACPNAYFACQGQGDTSYQMEYMQKAGVNDRCRWMGPQQKPFAALKMLDFYFNEFPVGGSQSIRECICAGIPATAMFYSPSHHHSVGADIVGEKHSIMSNDPEAYVAKAIEWINNPESRAEAAKDLFKRAQEKYSAKTFIQSIADLMEEGFEDIDY